MEEAICGYYGSYEGKVIGDDIGISMLTEAWERMLIKQEKELIIRQDKMIDAIRKSFQQELSNFKSSKKDLLDKIENVDKIVKSILDEIKGTKKDEVKKSKKKVKRN